MASRQRQSGTAGPRPTAELPAYEAPQHPLNAAAEQALRGLLQTHSLKKLNDHFEGAGNLIQESAAELNDRYRVIHESHQKRKRRAQAAEGQHDTVDTARNEQLEDMKSQVDRLTQRMEEGIRKIIDGHQAVASLEDCVKDVQQTVLNASPGAAQTQQSQRRRTQRGSDDDDDADFDPTAPDASTAPAVQPPSERFRQKLTTNKDRYQARSLATRYAQNNNYVNFRRVVHDAQHGDDAPPLSNAHTWFPANGPPAPGITTRGRAPVAGEEDSDDDIAIARERISTKCPLTLQEFKDPLTSKKCPHSFEKEAILGMINVSRNKDRAGNKQVQCPVPGCQMMLVEADLHRNAVLVRKIKRIQAAREMVDSDEEMGDDPNPQRPESIASDSGDDIDDVERRPVKTEALRLKREPQSSAVPGASVPPRPSQATVIVDLPSEDDDDTE